MNRDNLAAAPRESSASFAIVFAETMRSPVHLLMAFNVETHTYAYSVYTQTSSPSRLARRYTALDVLLACYLLMLKQSRDLALFAGQLTCPNSELRVWSYAVKFHFA